MTCGTYAAYRQHLKDEETPCDECRAASAAKRRQHRRRNGIPARREPRCGTVSGRTAHFKRGELPCDACREAFADWQRGHRRGEPVSRKHQRTTSADLILDVLETYGYAMTSDVLVSHVLDIRPEWKEPSVRRALFRMVDDGRVRQFERLGEWLYDITPR